MLFDLVRVFILGGESVPVCYKEETLKLMLQTCPVFQHAMVVPQMQAACSAHARNNSLGGNHGTQSQLLIPNRWHSIGNAAGKAHDYTVNLAVRDSDLSMTAQTMSKSQLFSLIDGVDWPRPFTHDLWSLTLGQGNHRGLHRATKTTIDNQIHMVV